MGGAGDLPGHMQASVLWKPGGPEALRFGTVADPEPGPGEVLVRTHATSVNRLDVWIRQGTYRVPLPHILGVDLAGEVVRADAAGRWKEGDRVVAYPGLSCGKCASCRKGKESLCPTIGILGRERHGTYAELVALPSENLYPLPARVGWEAAGAFPLSYLTAEHALSRAGVVAGETVVVFGASGGVGCAVLSRAVRRGARAIAVTGSPQLVPRLHVLGAEEVLMRGSSDLVERVQAATRGRGADVVVDTVGQLMWSTGLRALARGGRYVIVGVTSGAEVPTELRPIYTRQLSVLGGFLGDRVDFVRLLEDLARGRIEPQVAEVFPLERAHEAHRRLEAPHLGKFVLKP